MIKSIGCLVYDIHKKMFLLQQRSKTSSHPKKLGLWGGKMEAGETFGMALKREIKEELEVVPEYVKLYPLNVYLSKNNMFVYYSFLMIVKDYEGFAFNTRETFDAVWMPYQYIERLNLHPGFRETFEVRKDYIKEILDSYENS